MTRAIVIGSCPQVLYYAIFIQHKNDILDCPLINIIITLEKWQLTFRWLTELVPASREENYLDANLICASWTLNVTCFLIIIIMIVNNLYSADCLFFSFIRLHFWKCENHYSTIADQFKYKMCTFFPQHQKNLHYPFTFWWWPALSFKVCVFFRSCSCVILICFHRFTQIWHKWIFTCIWNQCCEARMNKSTNVLFKSILLLLHKK